MDALTAGQLLGIAPYTIEALEADADGWVATVRDMASHTRTERRVPGAPPPPAEPEQDAAQAEPDTVTPARAKPAKKAVKKAAAAPPPDDSEEGRDA